MVLNKSKWDNKAKIQYLKKHNIARPKPTQEVRPKWLAKKHLESLGNSWLNESENENSDWDSEDEAFLNHFYPQIADDNLSDETKRKLKKQIVKTVKKRAGQESEESEDHNATYNEEDGIYLGTRPEKASVESNEDEDEHEFSEDEFELEIPDFDAKLSEFVVSDLGKSRNRKMLKSKILDNLLDEYGLDSYSSTVKDTDYNKAKKNEFSNVAKLTAADLHGLRIGEKPRTDDHKKPSVQVLSEAELEQHRERAAKLQHAKFHEQIKQKFGLAPARGPAVLEINNINSQDKRQMAVLNSKLALEGETGAKINVDDDLDELLGLKSDDREEVQEKASRDFAGFDFLQQTLPRLASTQSGPSGPSAGPSTGAEKKGVRKMPATTDAFLDDLLGI